MLVRGLPRAHAEAAEGLTRGVWLSRTGANRVEVAPLRAAESGVAYLALHHLKGGQAPPDGWRGRRLRPSKGWWGADPVELRRAARSEVAVRAHAAGEHKRRDEMIGRLVEQGVPDDVARDHAYGPPEDPLPMPARVAAELVTIRRAR